MYGEGVETEPGWWDEREDGPDDNSQNSWIDLRAGGEEPSLYRRPFCMRELLVPSFQGLSLDSGETGEPPPSGHHSSMLMPLMERQMLAFSHVACYATKRPLQLLQ
jgi:hypothetical protein